MHSDILYDDDACHTPIQYDEHVYWMMMMHTFMLWYDTLYDDNACDDDVHSMMLRIPLQYDVHAC